MNRKGSKLQTYALFKRQKAYENYLTDIKNVTVRNNVKKFRLSDHKLVIEAGRHQKSLKTRDFVHFGPNLFSLFDKSINIQKIFCGFQCFVRKRKNGENLKAKNLADFYRLHLCDISHCRQVLVTVNKIANSRDYESRC